MSLTTRLLATLAVGTLALTACGSSNDSVASTASSASPAAPSASASATTAPVACPIEATEVPAPAGASTDLATKPVVQGSATPPPAVIQYADLVVGTGAEAVSGSKVTVKYVGAFYDTGTDFDSSWSRGVDETLPFSICRQGVIVGFAVGPNGMKVGGRRQITIPSEFGYGAAGQPPTIPADAALVFVVDLVSVG